MLMAGSESAVYQTENTALLASVPPTESESMA
jgi:hypothetical protein